MIPSVDTLTALARDVWEATLSSVVIAAQVNRAVETVPSLSWATEITGATPGVVILCMPLEAARAAAATMFRQELSATGAGDAEEAVAELANIFGGNVKGMLPGPNRLSLPRRAAPEEFRGAAEQVWFASSHGEFSVRVRLGTPVQG